MSKTTVALASVSKGFEVWVECLEWSCLWEEVDRATIPIRQIKLLAVFLAKASIDIVKLLSRIMLAAVMARRA